MKEIRFFLIAVLIVSVFLTGCAGISSRAAGKPEETTEGSSPTIPSEGTVSEGSESSSGDNPAVEESAPKEAPPEAEKAKESDMSTTSATKGDMLDEFSSSEKDFEMSLGGSDATKTLGKALERKAAPGESGLKAGYADDNKQYGYFVNFLAQYAQDVEHVDLPIQERIVFTIVDPDGKSVPNAEVSVYGGTTLLERGKSLADGSYLFFPSEYGESLQSYTVEVSAAEIKAKKRITVSRTGERKQRIELGTKRVIADPIPFDIVFVLDTTGSMGEEIERLKATIELIHMNLSNLPVKTDLRFGMVLYKDQGDEYVTDVVPLTRNLDEFQAKLDTVEADGGGDTAEDLQAALYDAVNSMAWNEKGIRLSFIITDAPPHLDYEQEVTYADLSRKAKQKGIKIHSVGTGGLPLDGEYILRQISQYTSGRYIFLTYGEEGESEGGAPGSVSHHTGANFQTDKLETIIIRFAKEEISYLTDISLEEDETYFQAQKIETEAREET
ncbi:MAG TPA: VWA domain-containing protein, partial [Spirochaetia bacterium]|nr:VWA domain-containing protein [Spirochaetia bacterium]